MVRIGWILGGVCLWVAISPHALGQTVQLPSIKTFSVNTSVLAPDRGSAHLGGIRRSSLGSTRYGTPGSRVPGFGRLLGNRALGGSTSGGGTSVHVTVIDHEALDRAVLAEARRRRTSRGGAFTPELTAVSNRLTLGARAAATKERGLMSVAEIRRQNAERRNSQQQEAARLAAQGKQAAELGSLGAAKIFYQMAHRRADVELQKEIVARLKQLQ